MKERRLGAVEGRHPPSGRASSGSPEEGNVPSEILDAIER
jgi:hypothetical protein